MIRVSSGKAMLRLAFVLFVCLSVSGRVAAESISARDIGIEISAGRPQDLLLLYETEQQRMLRILPPTQKPYVARDASGPVLFSPSRWPARITKGLIARDHGLYVTYPVTVVEDPITNARSLLNADGDILATYKPDADYEPFWLIFRLFPRLLDAEHEPTLAELFWMSVYDPSRFVRTFELLPDRKSVV